MGGSRKILHVVGKMDRGGVETWLMHVLRDIDRTHFDFHFLVHSPAEGSYDREIRSLNGKIHYCTDTRNPIKYGRQFKLILGQHGPFDVVHSHVYLYSGFVMRVAAQAGVPVRIAHSHTAPRNRPSNIGRRAYEHLMRHWIRRYATSRLGVTRTAADALFQNGFTAETAVLHYGLDFTRFSAPRDPRTIKARFGIPQDRKVIGHVGRFVAVKNHNFIVHIFQRVIESGVDAHLLLVGEGPLLPEIRAAIDARGLSSRCTFAGLQDDVVPFLSAMDLFVMPSVFEGLGIAVLEAQAAGLPVIASSSIPEDVDVIPGMVERISLEDGPAYWASAVIKKLDIQQRRNGAEALLLQKSDFALPVCIEKLNRIYSGEHIGGAAP